MLGGGGGGGCERCLLLYYTLILISYRAWLLLYTYIIIIHFIRLKLPSSSNISTWALLQPWATNLPGGRVGLITKWTLLPESRQSLSTGWNVKHIGPTARRAGFIRTTCVLVVNGSGKKRITNYPPLYSHLDYQALSYGKLIVFWASDRTSHYFP